MPLASGCQHIALMTADMDRFIAFYRDLFDAEVRLDMTEGPMRHVMIDLGGLWLHPFQLPGDPPDATARPQIFTRGHLDHFAVEMADPDSFQEVRRRAVERGASDGTVVDFGVVVQVTLYDPDGMEFEISLTTGDDRGLSFDERRHTPWPDLPPLGGERGR